MGRIGKQGLALHLRGYPVIPIKAGEKRPTFKEWPGIVATPERIAKWDTKFPTGGVGILTARFPAVDIDVRHVAVNAMLRTEVEFVAEGKLCVRIGAAPKGLILFRTSAPFRKRSTGTWLDENGEENLFEILCNGQQFVASHIHPDTGQPYAWEDRARTPLTVMPDELPEMTEEMAEHLIALAIGIFEARGWTRKTKNALSTLGSNSYDAADIVNLRDPVSDLSEKDIETRLSLLDWPNQGYEEWIGVGAALRHQFQGNEDEGLRLWHQFSALHGEYDESLAQTKWDSFNRNEGGNAKTFRYVLELTKDAWAKVRPPLVAADKQLFGRAIRIAFALLKIDPETTDDAFLLALDGIAGVSAWAAAHREDALKVIGRARDELLARPWLSDYLASAQGNILGCLENALVLLRNDPMWAGVVAYDEFERSKVKLRPVPIFGQDVLSLSYTEVVFDQPQRWTDDDTTRVRSYLQRARIMVSLEDTRAALDIVARESGFHPVRDYLNGLPKWDGVPRLDRWLHTYCGAADNEYTRGIGRWTIISMIARIMDPGCKVDHVLFLEGDQGIGKSSVVEILAGGARWYSDDLPSIGEHDVRTAMHLRGKWLVEFSDMSGIRRADLDDMKSFVSRKVQRYTPMYGREEVIEPRECIFIGTTNKEEWLQDETGNRRFWPVKIMRIIFRLLLLDRAMILAEALAAYRAGQPWHPSQEWQDAHGKPQQEARMMRDEREGQIEAWLVERKNEGFPVTVTTALEVWTGALHGTAVAFNRREQMFLGAVLRQMGWTRTTQRVDGKPQKRWLVPATGPDVGGL